MVQPDDNDQPAGGDARRASASLSFGAAAFIFQGAALRYASRGLEAITGYSARELLAMDFWDVVHPDDRELVRERGLARQRGELVPWNYEVKLLRKDGAPVW